MDLVYRDDWSHACAEISSAEEIAPGQSRTFWLALPVNHRGEIFPYRGARGWKEPDEGTPAYKERLSKRQAAARLAADSPQEAVKRVRAYWAPVVESRAKFQVPEASVTNLVRTSHCYSHILRYPIGKYVVPMGGDALDYYDFSERDNGYELVGIDSMGWHDDAELLLNFYLTRKGELRTPRWTLGQDEQGKWMTRDQEEDTQGLVLWALGERFMLSRDKAWLNRAWPWMKHGLEYIRRTRAKAKTAYPDPNDPRHGLWIAGAGEMRVDEPSHWYWYNYWIEVGLRYGVVEAEAMGESEYARVLRQEYSDFVYWLRRSIRQRFYRFDQRRAILPEKVEQPESPDVTFSQGAVYPSHSLNPWDPMVTQNVAYTDALGYARAGSFPCLMGGSIWPSQTADHVMVHLRRGEGDRTVDGFYAMLSTCGAMNSWGEGMAWENGLSTGGQPYMWANGAFLILLRNMLLHEAGDWLAATPAGPRELWVCPATPRKWMHQPEGIVVEHAPTYFGPVTFESRFDPLRRACTATIDFEQADELPERLIVHLRTLGGEALRRVTVNGKDHAFFSREQVIIAAPGRRLHITASCEA